MQSGLFIALYDEKTLGLYLKQGVYGFLMKPVWANRPSSLSRHYAALADYACTRAGTHIFFFLKRKIVYGGVACGSRDRGSFYLNGETSPLGRRANAQLIWDESSRYTPTKKPGVFLVNEAERAQPYLVLFEKNDLTGRWIESDALYWELGRFAYPLPSNSMQGMSFCTLTPGEVALLLELLGKTEKRMPEMTTEKIALGMDRTPFSRELITIQGSWDSEAHLEFMLLADPGLLEELLCGEEYVWCRQVPISPFKPSSMDRADICLYSTKEPIRGGTIPNIVIELKKERADYHAYNQLVRYLHWLRRNTDKAEFEKIRAYLIADSFHIDFGKAELSYEDKIGMYDVKAKKLYPTVPLREKQMKLEV